MPEKKPTEKASELSVCRHGLPKRQFAGSLAAFYLVVWPVNAHLLTLPLHRYPVDRQADGRDTYIELAVGRGRVCRWRKTQNAQLATSISWFGHSCNLMIRT
ncbi:hypothetical protein LY76DRAFT_226468 [Colletotrichum caudatum]|nr:hypothetical protein LY76DRAFT_226468 [Colletotrichum caudatum]